MQGSKSGENFGQELTIDFFVKNEFWHAFLIKMKFFVDESDQKDELT